MGIILDYSSYTQIYYSSNWHNFITATFFLAHNLILLWQLDAEAFNSASIHSSNQQKIMTVCCILLGTKGNRVMYKDLYGAKIWGKIIKKCV